MPDKTQIVVAVPNMWVVRILVAANGDGTAVVDGELLAIMRRHYNLDLMAPTDRRRLMRPWTGFSATWTTRIRGRSKIN